MTKAGGHFPHQWDQQFYTNAEYKCWMEQVVCPSVFRRVEMHVSLGCFGSRDQALSCCNYRHIAAFGTMGSHTLLFTIAQPVELLCSNADR